MVHQVKNDGNSNKYVIQFHSWNDMQNNISRLKYKKEIGIELLIIFHYYEWICNSGSQKLTHSCTSYIYPISPIYSMGLTNSKEVV